MLHSFRPLVVIAFSIAVCALVLLHVRSATASDVTAGSFSLPERISFNRDVRPIFSNTCFACHGPDANTREAGLRLDIRDDAIAERDGVRPIVPGNPEDSEAWLRITAKSKADQMPPADFHTQLSDRDKAIIKRWIEEGAKYERHWSFIPPTRPAVPRVSPNYRSSVKNPIDTFVIARLEPERMKPSAPADRRTLIRRITLDLTGLPPTPDEVEAFVDDTSADAYEKVVDRLLSSPAYAEHMTRFWLDVSRYADSNGYQYDLTRHQWVWRDWVIHAFDTNMPFDQFTIQQTAGDLLPAPELTEQTRLATGFHRNHPITIEGGTIDEEYRTEYVMDRVVTTTTAWMGMTFLCARCHDHKYDPISQDEFYSFYAFFNSAPERGVASSDGRFRGFEPFAKIASPLRTHAPRELRERIEAAQKRFDDAVARSGGSLATWEQRLAAEATAAALATAVQPEAMIAQGGTELKRLEDGSVLATGPNPGTQVYEVTFSLGDAATRAIRLEALTHEAHVNRSTGRGSNGNFVLGEVQVEAGPSNAEDAAMSPVRVLAAEADYEQKGYPVAAAIDGHLGRGGWAVDGNIRAEPSSATFTFAEPIPARSRVRVKLVHTFGHSHTIGRFRLSVPTDGQPPVSSAIRKIMDKAAQERTGSERSALAEELVRRYGGAELIDLAAELRALQAQVGRDRQDEPATLILAELPKPRPTYVLDRGEYDKPMKDRPVGPEVPAVFGGLPEGLPRNRLGLARWLVSRENPLTARVTVNRFWAHLFGTGLVKTVEDFGSQGEYPSHPELLDWLAVEFMDNGWDVKHILKTIVTSGTYRQSSTMTPESFAADPANRLLARGPRYRLDAESIRDSALVVSGLLDRSIGGPSVYPYHPQGLWLEVNNRPKFSSPYPHQTSAAQLYRRSMYTYWKRAVPPPSMDAFDAPSREYCVVNRSRTNTPLQAFVMLHDPQFVEAARKLAERMINEGSDDPAARITYGFELCTAREPTAEELGVFVETFRERLDQYRSDPKAADRLLSVGQSPRGASIDSAELAAYTTVARLLLNLSEFITKG